MKSQQYLAFVILTCASVLCLATESEIKSEQFVGLGMSKVSIDSGHPSIGNQSVSGLVVQFGYRNQNHVFEMATGGADGLDVGPTYDIYYPEDSAEYMYLSLSYIYQFRNLLEANAVIPYLGGGWHISSVNWDTYVYDHTGEGITIVGGIIIPLEDRLFINVSARQLRYSGERLLFGSWGYDNYDTVVNEVAVTFLFRFNINNPSCGIFFC